MERIYFGYIPVSKEGISFAFGCVNGDGSLEVSELKVNDIGIIEIVDDGGHNLKNPNQFRVKYMDVRGTSNVFDGKVVIRREMFDAQVSAVKGYLKEYFKSATSVKFVYKTRNER